MGARETQEPLVRPSGTANSHPSETAEHACNASQLEEPTAPDDVKIAEAERANVEASKKIDGMLPTR